jgi:phenylacetate-CoA ligase
MLGSLIVQTTEPSRRDAYGRLFDRLLWPAWEKLRGRPTLELLRRIQLSQWSSPDELERAQLAALKRLLEHAGTHVPYYREVFAKVGFDPRGVTSAKDLEVLPPLTRDIVRARYDDLIDPAYRGTMVKKGTSGSTGVPLKFEYSQDSEHWRTALRVRGWGWAGYRPGEPTIFYWGQVAALGLDAKAIKIRLDRALKREVFLDSMRQDEEARREAVNVIRTVKPRVIVCFTQSCAQLARWITDHGLRTWDDIPVICGAEAVLPADRAALSAAFGPRVFETYGSRETMLIAAECGAHDGMHISQEHLVVETVKEGRGVAYGTPGDVLVTDLHNLGMPFIRYMNGDVATLSPPGKCACGRGLQRLQRVDGRRADTLIDRDGNPIPGLVFHVLFADAHKELLRQFQATQKANGEVVLRIVKGPRFTEEDFAKVLAKFGQYLRGLPIAVETVSFIPPAPNGKMRTIVVERAPA